MTGGSTLRPLGHDDAKTIGGVEDARPSHPVLWGDTDRLFDIAVLGAGVVGVATAYALARRDASVVLVDRLATPGGGASFANGGQLSYAYTDTLASPALLKKLPFLMSGGDPLFKLRPQFDIGWAAWGVQFLRACNVADHRAGTLEILELALQSQAAMQGLLHRHPLEFGRAAVGKMHLYYDARAFAAAHLMAELKAAHGASQHMLGPSEAVRLEPALSGAGGIYGVVHSPADEVGDARRFCSALSDVLTQHYGVTTAYGFDARNIETTAEDARLIAADGRMLRARQVVVAMGAQSRDILNALGFKPPLLPVKGYSFTAPPGEAAPMISLTDTARKLVFCMLNGEMRVAGVAEVGSSDPRVDPALLSALISSAKASLPHAADYVSAGKGWAGLRPMTPTSVPIIRRVRERVVVNIGHGMLGWTLAMGSAERTAALFPATMGEGIMAA